MEKIMATTHATTTSRLEQDPMIQLGALPDTGHRILGLIPQEALRQYDLTARAAIGELETLIAFAQAAGVDDKTIAALGNAIPAVASSVAKFSNAPNVSLGYRVVNVLRQNRRK